MAIQPTKFNSQYVSQPGAHGEIFNADYPGYRDNADRINRSNNKLNVSQHDVPNIKYEFDDRLPVLFKYGFAYGFNQLVITKGRIVAVDPNMDLVDFEMKKQYNTLTLANGGVPVRLRATGDVYKAAGKATGLISAEEKGQAVPLINKEWIPIIGMEEAYTDNCFRPFKTKGPAAQMVAEGYSINAETGRVMKDEAVANNVRPANIPIGMLQRNEYTRDVDAFNGMMPGPVLTDAMVELPWFAYKNKAENNPWGSAYGALFPGALVKSDENGRVTISPLSFEAEMADMTLAEYELERQQVIGQIYSVNNNLIPEGAAKWATWALEERMDFENFNPDVYRQNNRRGEDSINNSPYNSTGNYPGYPYEPTISSHDLHMLGSTGRGENYDPRMNPEYQYENLGIPGLTDGYNAVIREVPAHSAGFMHHKGTADKYEDMFFRTLNVNIAENTLQIQIGDGSFVNCVEGAVLADGALKVKYANEKQGIVVLSVVDSGKTDTLLNSAPVEVKFKYSVRGLAGVPTFLDWDGICGSVKLLLTK